MREERRGKIVTIFAMIARTRIPIRLIRAHGETKDGADTNAIRSNEYGYAINTMIMIGRGALVTTINNRGNIGQIRHARFVPLTAVCRLKANEREQDPLAEATPATRSVMSSSWIIRGTDAHKRDTGRLCMRADSPEWNDCLFRSGGLSTSRRRGGIPAWKHAMGRAMKGSATRWKRGRWFPSGRYGSVTPVAGDTHTGNRYARVAESRLYYDLGWGEGLKRSAKIKYNYRWISTGSNDGNNSLSWRCLC